MIGQVVDERYRLVRLLGEGAMGAVYEAAHVNTGRTVAIKLIQQMALTESDVYARFEREARVAGAIDSRHVASVLDSGRDKASGLPYIALEMLRGEDLGTYLERSGALPPSLALRLLTQACTGLAKAHAAEVVHRDIKPANIFLALDEDELRVTVKILDFGIAKFRPSGGQGINLTQTGKMLGTPRYMSPEQAQGEKDIDFRTDVWSLGSVLYEALTGRPPHDEPDHIGKLIFSICSSTPPTPSSLVPGLSTEIDRVVMRTLATARGDRHATAIELLGELEALTPNGADILAEEVRLRVAGEPRRVSRVSQRLSGSQGRHGLPASAGGAAERPTQPDARVVIDRASEEAGIASTMFATNSTYRGALLPQRPRRRWLFVAGAGGAIAAGAVAFALRGGAPGEDLSAGRAGDTAPTTVEAKAPASASTSAAAPSVVPATSALPSAAAQPVASSSSVPAAKPTSTPRAQPTHEAQPRPTAPAHATKWE